MTELENTSELPPFEELYRRARAAYSAGDVTAYEAFFSPDLRYHQPDGRVISRDQLMRDIVRQFRIVSAADTHRSSDVVEVSSEGVIETATQKGWFAARAFGLLHRIWGIERRSRCTWRQFQEGWKICEVVVLHEQVVSCGFQFGWKPPRLSMSAIFPSDTIT